MTLKSGLGVTQGHRNRHVSIRHYDFLLTFHSIHWPYRFRDKRWFPSKIAKFSHPPCVFLLPWWRGSPWNWVLALGDKKKTRMMRLPGRERSLAISSAVWIQSTNVTDGHTYTGRQQRLRLRIASRGKNSSYNQARQILYKLCLSSLPTRVLSLYPTRR